MGRLEESRRLLKRVFEMAYEVYLEEERDKGDSWRDKSVSELYEHLKSEISEIMKDDDPNEMLHDCLDACALSALLAAKIIIETGASRYLKFKKL